MHELDFKIPWGVFHKAIQGHPLVCEVGVMLFLNHNHYVYIRYAPGRVSNNKAEFIALRTLLEVAMQKGVRKLQELGDCKLVTLSL
jgi:ribonuclease HI